MNRRNHLLECLNDHFVNWCPKLTVFLHVPPSSAVFYIFRHILPYSAMYRHYAMFRYVPPYSVLFCHVPPCSTMFRHILSCSARFRHLSPCSIMFCHVPRHVLPCSAMFLVIYGLHISSYFIIFHHTCLKLGKLQCKSNFNRNEVLFLKVDNFEPNQIV